MSLEEAALGVHRVLNTQMAEGIRLTTIRQGLDPRKFTLVSLGGGGGLHIVALAEALHITRVLIPPHPGVLSAQGLLAAPIEHELSMAFPRPLEGLNVAEVRKRLKELDNQCAKLTALEGLHPRDVEISYFVDMCHTGQSYHIEIPLDLGAKDPVAKLFKLFLAAHDRIHGYSTDSPASVVNLRTTHRSKASGTFGKSTYRTQKGDEIKGKRKIFLERNKPITVPVYERHMLAMGKTFSGPAIIEQIDTTTLVPPGWSAQVLRDGTILLTS